MSATPPATSADFYLLTLSGDAYLSDQWPHVARALKGLRPFFESREIAGTDWDAHLQGLQFAANATTRRKWRIFGDNTSFYVQSNTGTDADPTWVTASHADADGFLSGMRLRFKDANFDKYTDELHHDGVNFYLSESNDGKAQINLNGQIRLSDIANPAVTFEGDTDTGVRRSAANTVTLVAGGTDGVDVTASAVTIKQAATATGTLNVQGATDLDTTLNVDGATTLQGNLNAQEPASFDGVVNLRGGVTGMYLGMAEDVNTAEMQAPSDNDVLQYDLATSKWRPTAVATSKATGNFFYSKEWTLTHNLATTDVVWSTYDEQNQAIIPTTADFSNPNIAYFYFPASSEATGRAVVIG
jgi:hypothetical protein